MTNKKVYLQMLFGLYNKLPPSVSSTGSYYNTQSIIKFIIFNYLQCSVEIWGSELVQTISAKLSCKTFKAPGPK